MKPYGIKLLALALAFLISVGVLPAGAIAEGLEAVFDGEDTVYLLAGTDFQPLNEDTALGIDTVSGIVESIQNAGYTDPYGFLFLGDYSRGYVNSTEMSTAGLTALRGYAEETFGEDLRQVYVQGNHDPDGMVGSALTKSGANDTERYGVFVINEMDYMWLNSDEGRIRSTAARLKTYLDSKLEECYDRPVFVLSHLPLHYSMRTYTDGDGQYASYLFDVLNEAGKAGLNIIFLFGHNHAHGWDDYLGGASVRSGA